MNKLFEKMKKDREAREDRKASAQRRTYQLSKHKEAIIRLFPNKKDKDDLNFMDFGQHFVRENAASPPSVVQCVLMSNPEHVCPVCNAYAEAHAILKDRGLDAKVNPEMKNLESGKATRKVLWAGIYAESKNADGSYKWSDPVVFEIPPSAFDQIQKQYADTYENYDQDAIDQHTGFPFRVSKTGTGFDTVYTVTAMPKATFAVSDEKIANQLDLAPFVTDMKIADMMTCVARLHKIAGISRTITPASLQLAPEIFEAIGGKSAPTLADKTLSAAAESIERPVTEKPYDSNVVDMDIDSAMSDDVTFSAEEKQEMDTIATPAPKTNDELDNLLDEI